MLMAKPNGQLIYRSTAIQRLASRLAQHLPPGYRNGLTLMAAFYFGSESVIVGAMEEQANNHR